MLFQQSGEAAGSAGTRQNREMDDELTLRVSKIVSAIPCPVNCYIILSDCHVRAHQLVLARESLFFQDLFRTKHATDTECEISLEHLVQTAGFLLALFVMYSRFQSLPIPLRELLSGLSDQDRWEAVVALNQLGVVALDELKEPLYAALASEVTRENEQLWRLRAQQIGDPCLHKCLSERAASISETVAAGSSVALPQPKSKLKRNTHRFVATRKGTASDKFIEVRRLTADQVHTNRLNGKSETVKNALVEMQPMMKKMKLSLNTHNVKLSDCRPAEPADENLELDHQPPTNRLNTSSSTSGPSRSGGWQCTARCMTSILAFAPSTDGSPTLQTQLETPYNEDALCPSDEFSNMERMILQQNLKADKKHKPRRRSSKTKAPRDSNPASPSPPAVIASPVASPLAPLASDQTRNLPGTSDYGGSFMQLICSGIAPVAEVVDDWTKEFLIEEDR